MCTLNAAPPPQGYFIGSAASSSSALGGAGGAAALPVALVVSGMSRWDRWPVTAAASLSNPAHAHVSFHGSPPTGCISGSQRQKYLSQSASFLIDVHGTAARPPLNTTDFGSGRSLQEHTSKPTRCELGC